MEGNWVTGKPVIANIPKKTIINDITIDKTGLCINLLNIFNLLLSNDYDYSDFNFKLDSIFFGSR